MTNARRHGYDLPIRDKDLTTGRDVRRIVAVECEAERGRTRQLVDQLIAVAVQDERDRVAREVAAAHAAVWYRRLWRKVSR